MGQAPAEMEQAASPAEAPEWFKRWCSCLGMSSEAPDAWALIHVKPHIAFLICIPTNIAAASIAIVFLLASQPYRWFHHSATVLWALFHFSCVLMSWRYGPLPSGRKQKIFIGLFGAFIGSYNAVFLVMMFGPEERCIFQSRMAFALFDALYISLVSVSAFFGSWPPDIPKSPYRSVVPPLAETCVTAFRLIDAHTDMLVIKLLLELAEEPCTWFGSPGRCSNWVAMAVVVGVFTSIDLTISISLAMGGANLSHSYSSERVRKFFLRMHVVSFVCELAVVLATLIKLGSDLSRSKGADDGSSDADVRSSIILTCLSVCVTCATFTMTMFGAKRIIAAARRVATSARGRLSAAPRSAAPSANGAAREAPPASDAHRAEAVVKAQTEGADALCIEAAEEPHNEATSSPRIEASSTPVPILASGQPSGVPDPVEL